MKFTTQEEYGLRLLVRLGYAYNKGVGLTIPEISEHENLSQHNVAKILRILRLGGLLESERGRLGGYALTRNPKEMLISNILDVLGEKFFDINYCNSHISDNEMMICKHTANCSVRSLWRIIQYSIDNAVKDLTLNDLLQEETFLFKQINKQVS
ncbi:MAG: transcriptional regulator [Ignavibacteriae bacterium]|nr:MAG: transcriptional regulator [Ignavibacteriota bacterium]